MNDKKSVEEKLKSLGVILGADSIPKPKKKKSRLIEDVFDGQYEKTPFGEVFIVKEVYPLRYEHGQVSFPAHLDYGLILKWANVPPHVGNDLKKIAFIDTETSGLSRGSGTFAFLIGIGYLDNGQFNLIQILMPDPSLESAALSALIEYLHQFEIIVSYNGKSFDVPILEHRHILNGLSSPFPNLHHVDLLHLVRKIYKNRLPSRRLGDLESTLLNYQRGKEEVPGWLVPQIYKDFLKTADPQPLTGVLYHNAVDIVTLAAVFILAAQILNDPLHDQIESLDLIAIGNIYEELGYYETAIRIYEQCLVRDLPNNFYLKTLLRFASMYKKAGERDKAVSLWEQAVKLNNIDASIELAKHYEHAIKNYDKALGWTNKALEILKNDSNPLSRLSIPEVVHRKSRLVRKRAKQ